MADPQGVGARHAYRTSAILLSLVTLWSSGLFAVLFVEYVLSVLLSARALSPAALAGTIIVALATAALQEYPHKQIVLAPGTKLVTALGPAGMLALTLPLTLLLAVLFATALFFVAERPYFTWHRRPSLRRLANSPAASASANSSHS